MFQTSLPVTSRAFFDREQALEMIRRAADRLRAGAPSWLCILGPRKVGKTSLVLEFARRNPDPGIVFVLIDVLEGVPGSLEVFRRCALRAVDGALVGEPGISLEAVSRRPREYRRALQRSARFAKLPAEVQENVLDLPDRRLDVEDLEVYLHLPEQLAEALGITMIVALDEFQELAGAWGGRKPRELLPALRSAWQKHKRVAYVISGSAKSMLTDLVTREHSPFFQHFSLLELGPFERKDAVHLLRKGAPPGRPISRQLAEQVFDAVGGHPFYLQLLGELLTNDAPPYTERSLKDALQELLFSSTGRLALYFQNEFERLVGHSAYLSAVLEAVATDRKTLTEVAHAIGAPSGATVRYLQRLGDAVVKGEDGRYDIADQTFRLWVCWRAPGGTVIPMKVIGDEAEQVVAERLALMGFDLVYQSRASRGAFDLLATRGANQLGIQVKRTSLPARFRKAEWGRMVAEARRLGWLWLVAIVTPPPGTEVHLLDPAGVRPGPRGLILPETAAIENVLSWVDQKASGIPRRRRPS